MSRDAPHVTPVARPWPDAWIVPDWPAPANIQAVITTRVGGVSRGPWGAGDAGGMNLGSKSGDDPAAVSENRRRLAAMLPSPPLWLAQVHGADVAAVDAPVAHAADAATALAPGVVCAVSIADCLPVLFTDDKGRGVAAAHAGWRGLAAGVLQNTVKALRERLGDPQARLLAFLGPAIGPQRFEVGQDVLLAMQARLPQAGSAFLPLATPGKYLADLCALARQALGQVQVQDVYGGHWCTLSDAERFYSFRRDRVTGRHAALIWRTLT